MTFRPSTALRCSVPLVMAAALLAACTNGRVPAQVQGTVNMPDLSADRTQLAAKAASLGLAGSDSYVTPTQFEVMNTAGAPVGGATITVNGHMLTADGRGVIEVPADALNTDLALASVEASGYVPRTVKLLPGAAIKLQPVDSNVTTLGAAGGTARNAEGNLEVVVPPGALTGDTPLRVTRSFSETFDPSTPIPSQLDLSMGSDKDGGNKDDLKVDTAQVPLLGQYGYNIDLGGKDLAPGTHMMVRFKTEGKFKDLLAKHLDAGDPMDQTTESVSKDANGDIWVAMLVIAPTPAGTTPAAMPAAATATASHMMSLLSIPGCQSWRDAIPHSTWVPEQLGGSANDGNHTNDQNAENDWMSANEANSRATTICTTRGGLPMSQYGWITLQTHDGRYNGGHCNYFQFDPNKYECVNNKIYRKGYWDTTYTYDTSMNVSAHVSWASDDPRISGQPVASALVNFNHGQSSARMQATSIYTDGGGDATTVGLAYSNGYATASLPGEPAPWAIMGAAGYSINCGVAQIHITKNKPQVTLATNAGGVPTVPSINWPTNLGAMSGAASNPTWAPAIDLNVPAVNFSVNGSIQPTGDSWADIQSGTASIGWNQTTRLPADIWWSKQIGVVLSYASNDASVPADMQPNTKWAGQPAPGSNLIFSHQVSGASSKPAARGGDQLNFSNVGSAVTWGLNGTNGTANATHTSGPVQLKGSASYTINGTTNVPLTLNANLPEVILNIQGSTNNQPWGMDYTLTRSDGTQRQLHMQLPAPAQDGKVHIWLPAEEPVGTAYSWSFQPTFITNGDYAVQMPDGSFNFTALTNLARGTSTPYTALKTTFTTPK